MKWDDPLLGVTLGNFIDSTLYRGYVHTSSTWVPFKNCREVLVAVLNVLLVIEMA